LQCAHAGVGERQPDDRADQGDDERFGQQLSTRFGRGSRQRRSHRYLACARSATAEQQVGHVDAREQ
jgi:predicted secreted protein